jgi:TMEM199 family protein
MQSNSTLDVSFESHLKLSLSRIKELLPPPEREQLSQSMARPTVDYSLLLAISKWARSSVGETALRSASMDPSSFSMISLLAGATTSPNRIFPQYVPPPSQEVLAAQRKKERQAITALVNAVLSVGGSGAGAYYASDKTGWKNEWVCNWLLTSSIKQIF